MSECMCVHCTLMCVTAFLHSVLTNSQLCGRFLVQPAELCSVDVVGFKDADELLQSFLAQPRLHILLWPISKQQPGVTRQLPSCKKHTTGREEVLCYYTPVSCNTTYLMQTNNFLSHSTEKDTIPRCWYGGRQLLSCMRTNTHIHTHALALPKEKKIKPSVVLPACSSSTFTWHYGSEQTAIHHARPR